MTTAPVATTGPRRGLVQASFVWRMTLALGWISLLVVCVVLGERPASFGDLQRAVAAGEVHEVRIAGGLSAEVRGYSTAEVHWRDGLIGHSTQVVEARPRSEAPRRFESGHRVPVIEGDLGTRLQQLQPGLEVVRVPRADWGTSWAGWQLPGWTGWLTAILGLGTLLLLLGSPEPWRATRWAWFWLMLSAAPVAVPAYLLLSGPTPLLPRPRNPARRLTGGWGFLLAMVLSSVLDASQ